MTAINNPCRTMEISSDHFQNNARPSTGSTADVRDRYKDEISSALSAFRKQESFLYKLKICLRKESSGSKPTEPIKNSRKFAELRKREKKDLIVIEAVLKENPAAGVRLLITSFIKPERTRSAQKLAIEVIKEQLTKGESAISEPDKADLAAQFFSQLPHLHTSPVTRHDGQLRGIHAAAAIYSALDSAGRLKAAPAFLDALPALSDKKHWWETKRSGNSNTSRGMRIADFTGNYHPLAAFSYGAGYGGGGYGGGGGGLGDLFKGNDAATNLVMGVVVAVGTIVALATVVTVPLYVGVKVATTKANKPVNLGAIEFSHLLNDAYAQAEGLASKGDNPQQVREFTEAMSVAIKKIDSNNPDLDSKSKRSASRPKVAQLFKALNQHHQAFVNKISSPHASTISGPPEFV